MKNPSSTHLVAIFQALLVTFLWSTSFVLVKIGLLEIPALTFAGLRYTVASLSLLSLVLFRPEIRNSLKRIPKKDWLRLIFLGLLFYSVTQGVVFIGLSYLSAATVSLILSFTPIVVALFSLKTLSEGTTRIQWLGLVISLIGAILYFISHTPARALSGSNSPQILGIIFLVLGLFTNSLSSMLGRSINKKATISPMLVTAVSMGIGAFALMLIGIPLQGLPDLNIKQIGIIAWLAVVNTAIAFTLWNRSLRWLTAVESSVINNTMLIQTAFLAWVFLAERLSKREIVGLLLASLGVLIFQFHDLPKIRGNVVK